MYCPQCRTELPDDAKYCIKCSYDFTRITTPSSKELSWDSLDEMGTSFGVDIEDDSFKVGSLFANRYEILLKGLNGGMGVVVKCRDTKLNKIVALKIIHPRLLKSKNAISRFRQEVAISQELQHPNIVRVFNLEECDGKEYLTMEWVEGVTLREIIKKRQAEKRPFSLKDAQTIIFQLCDALQHAHQHTIHRDIKPENIIVSDEKGLKVKLTDFGIAKMLSPSQFASTSIQMGTPYYMAPEQKMDAANVDRGADIYALGVILFELLTLENTIGLKLPSQINSNIPKGIDDMLVRALEPRPTDRYKNASDLASALKTIITKEVVGTEQRQTGEKVYISITQQTSSSLQLKSPEEIVLSVQMFMSSFLQKRYSEKFRCRTPYRTMFESENYLVYFQNFNKAETVNMWYRLSEGSLDTLRNTAKSAIVCFTNPASGVIFAIPMRDIDNQASKANWGKAFFEVHIDPASSCWRELDWNIENYLIKNIADAPKAVITKEHAKTERLWPEEKPDRKKAAEELVRNQSCKALPQEFFGKPISAFNVPNNASQRDHISESTVRSARITALMNSMENTTDGMQRFAGKDGLIHNISAEQYSRLVAKGGEMVHVEGGTFEMIDIFGDLLYKERAGCTLRVDDFYIGKYPITQGQWKTVMENNPSYFKDGGGNCPVENIRLEDVQEFIRRLNDFIRRFNPKMWNNYRLPTEAEWEYAARSGGQLEKWAGTDTESVLGDYAWYSVNSDNMTHPIGQKKPNMLGIYDMSGNVYEFCLGENIIDSMNNPTGLSNNWSHVLRGGSWDDGPQKARVDRRSNIDPGMHAHNVGFRLARSVFSAEDAHI